MVGSTLGRPFNYKCEKSVPTNHFIRHLVWIYNNEHDTKKNYKIDFFCLLLTPHIEGKPILELSHLHWVILTPTQIILTHK